MFHHAPMSTVLTDMGHVLNRASYHMRIFTPKEVVIASFGLYLNSNWPPMKNFLKEVGRIDHKVFCGVPDYNPCRSDCEECAEKRLEYLDRCEEHSKAFKSVVWCRQFHLKAIAFSDGECIIGGRNLSGSTYTDLSMTMKSVNLYNHVLATCEDHSLTCTIESLKEEVKPIFANA